MTRLGMSIDERRRRRQLQHRLRHVVAWIRKNLSRELIAFRLAGLRPDEHPVAAGFVRRFHNHLVQLIEHEVARLLINAAKRRHVLQDRFFRQVVTDDVRHVRINHFVVRDAAAGCVRKRNVALAPRTYQTTNTQRRILAEDRGIEKQIVDAAVDHVHLHETLDRAHVHLVVATDDQIGAYDELRGHRLREVCVLEVCRVLDARRQYDDLGIAPTRRERRKATAQLLGIVVDWIDRVLIEELGKDPLHYLAVFEHIRHTRRHTQVVLEHVYGAVGIAYEIGAAHVAPDTMWGIDAEAFRTKLARLFDQLARQYTVAQRALVVIDVVDEPV